MPDATPDQIQSAVENVLAQQAAASTDSPQVDPPNANPVNMPGDTDVLAGLVAKVAELEGKLAQATTTSEVAPLTTTPSQLDTSTPLANIEPGLRWAVRQGFIDAEKLGAHIVKFFEDGVL